MHLIIKWIHILGRGDAGDVRGMRDGSEKLEKNSPENTFLVEVKNKRSTT